jgi:single-stranded DNA-binding protein
MYNTIKVIGTATVTSVTEFESGKFITISVASSYAVRDVDTGKTTYESTYTNLSGIGERAVKRYRRLEKGNAVFFTGTLVNKVVENKRYSDVHLDDCQRISEQSARGFHTIKVMGAARLGSVRLSPTKKIATLSLVSDIPVWDKDTEKTNYEPSWFNAVNRGEMSSSRISGYNAGDILTVCGDLITRDVPGKDGTYKATEVVLTDCQRTIINDNGKPALKVRANEAPAAIDRDIEDARMELSKAQSEGVSGGIAGSI